MGSVEGNDMSTDYKLLFTEEFGWDGLLEYSKDRFIEDVQSCFPREILVEGNGQNWLIFDLQGQSVYHFLDSRLPSRYDSVLVQQDGGPFKCTEDF